MIIRGLAKFVGNVIHLRLPWQALYIRDMETLKIKKLKENKEKIDAIITTYKESKKNKWWIENIKGCSMNLISYIQMLATQVGMVQMESA